MQRLDLSPFGMKHCQKSHVRSLKISACVAKLSNHFGGVKHIINIDFVEQWTQYIGFPGELQRPQLKMQRSVH